MKIKTGIAYMLAGVGATLMYQQVKNGNVEKTFNDVKKKATDATKMLENMK